MSQRVSGYARKANDLYETPSWCTEALIPHLRAKPPEYIVEPAAGSGKIVEVLRAAGFRVTAYDLSRNVDFLQVTSCKAVGIVTNPPYGKAEEFIVHALDLTEPHGFVAMLLRCDYDHAASRRYLFDAPFAKRLVLTQRIRWIEGSTGSPSFNHSWWIWDWQHKGPPTIGYAP